jgi:urease accessory protein
MAQPRAQGAASLCVAADDAGVTRIRDLRQSGSMKLAFPQTHRKDIEAILVNTAGGITGGDRFSIAADVQPDATLTLTTQAAERAYKAQPGETGQVTTTLTVAANARLNWLPQELILFDRCALTRGLEVSLATGARLLMVEPVVFGRVAMNEQLRDVMFQDRIRIWRAGLPLYADGMSLQGDAAARLARGAIADGAGAMASLVYVAPDASSHLAAIRALLPATAGASMLASDVLVLRQLAPDSLELRRALIPVLDRLTQNTLPTSWRL